MTFTTTPPSLFAEDVSHHVEDIWTPHPASVLTFVKATQGNDFVSPALSRLVAEARDAGKTVGFYHCIETVDQGRGKPAEQAKFFADSIAPLLRDGDLLSIDFEPWQRTAGNPGTGPVRATVGEAVAFGSAVGLLLFKHRLLPYMNLSTFRDVWKDSPLYDGLWLAWWPEDEGDPKPGTAPPVPWRMWQTQGGENHPTGIDQNQVNFPDRASFDAWRLEKFAPPAFMPGWYHTIAGATGAHTAADPKSPRPHIYPMFTEFELVELVGLRHGVPWVKGRDGRFYNYRAMRPGLAPWTRAIYHARLVTDGYERPDTKSKIMHKPLPPGHSLAIWAQHADPGLRWLQGDNKVWYRADHLIRGGGPPAGAIGTWYVDRTKVTTVLLGVDASGTRVDGRELKPGAAVAGVMWAPDRKGMMRLWTAAGVGYAKAFLTQTRQPAKPPPKPGPKLPPFPKIPKYARAENLPFRGRRTCICVATWLPWLEHALLVAKIIRFNVDIYQLGYNKGGVSASAGTHDRGGAADQGQFRDAALKIKRQMGGCCQRRTPAQGFDLHDHGWPNRCPHGSSGLRYQMSRWRAGRNGLKSNGRIGGPGPIGTATPSWTAALSAYKRKVTAASGRAPASLFGVVGLAGAVELDTPSDELAAMLEGMAPGDDLLPEADPAWLGPDVVALDLAGQFGEFELADVPDDVEEPEDFDDGSDPELAAAAAGEDEE